MHIELTNGQSAELRELATLTDGDAEDLSAALFDSIPKDDAGNQQNAKLNPARFKKATERAVVAMVLESWTLPVPVPTMDDLDAFRALGVQDMALLVAAVKEHRALLAPDFTESQDPQSPTKPSNE